MSEHQQITRVRRQYNQWVADQTLEDYALRFTADKARRWSPFGVGNTAFGAISFLACEAIGGSLTLAFGFTNTMLAIGAVSLLIFFTSLPIGYYAAKYGVDMDLLTRGAGFGYIGSTITSLIYACFTFILFAVEATIMSQAITMCFGIPIAIAHIISATAVLPVAILGIRVISRMQLWTQPVWLVLQLAPLGYLMVADADIFGGWVAYGGEQQVGSSAFDLTMFGAAVAVVLSLLPQIGEQVDYLRFLPAKSRVSRASWWWALLIAGPGWIVVGAAKLAAGSFLAYIAIKSGMTAERAVQPPELYRMAFSDIFHSPALALVLTAIFVVTCQMKINVTNAYAGSIAWSNFFSRLTHSHPGRVVWLVFNVLLALMLMEFGIFKVIERILGLYSNLAVAWIGALSADLVVNKSLKLSPPDIEFRRAHLYDINPVGIGAMLLSLVVSTAAHFGLLGDVPRALAPLIGFVIAFIAAPLIAWATKGRYYIARHPAASVEGAAPLQCSICEHAFEPNDMSFCPAYQGAICSLCCSLEMRCHDRCKEKSRLSDQVWAFAATFLPTPLMQKLGTRVGRFVVTALVMVTPTGILLAMIGAEMHEAVPGIHPQTMWLTLETVFAGLLVILGLSAWAFVLAQESRRIAEEETQRQTSMLVDEITAHKHTDAALQKAKEVAEAANLAKTRFMLGLSHEIRTPLNSIDGYAQLLERKPTRDPVEAVRVIRRSAAHITNLVDGLLDISKIETGSLHVARDKVNFADFLDQLVDMLRLQAAAKGLEFRYTRSPSLPAYVHMDQKRVRQILLNLLSNAVKFTDRGHVALDVHYRSSLAEFEVSDSGVGIPADEISRVFEPFERGRAAGNIPGTGLGLTISKLLTQIVGGDLTVQSQVNSGSTFTMRLMLSETSPNGGHEAERAVAGYRGPPRTILVADDDRANGALFEELLVPLGFKVLVTGDGVGCVELVRVCKPDLVVLDISMPGMTGWEVARHLRAQGLGQTAILMISADSYQLSSPPRGEIYHDDHILKPLDFDQLLEKLHTLLDLEWIYADLPQAEVAAAAT